MSDLIEELKRRNVFRVGIAYVVIAWLLAQVADLALDSFDAPDWVMKTILLLLALGFPLALFFAWAFELTPEGLKKEKNVDRSKSIAPETGRKLDRVITGVLAVAVGVLLVDKFLLQPSIVQPVTQDVQAVEQVAGTDEKSIAVLPFVDMSPAKDQEYFTDGLTENLLNALAQIREIKVAGRTSSFAFKGRNEDLRSVGQQLNVQNILEGSVQKAGNQIRVTAQLVNTDDGFHLWSETFDRSLNDIFAVQDEIAAAVVLALKKSILGQEQAVDTGYAGKFEAYNAYLLGQSYDSQNTFEGWERAIEQYRLALEIDPDMALAWAGLSRTLSDQTGFTSNFATGYEQARKAAEKAIELDARLPEAYLALAAVQRSHDWDWPAVENSLQRALALRPGDPDIRAKLAELMAARGDVAGALREVEQVISQDPLNFDVQRTRIWLLIRLGRGDEAVAGAQQLMEIQPGRGGNGVMLSVALFERGDNQLALEAAQKETIPFLRLTAEAITYCRMDDKKLAEERLSKLVAEFGDDVSYQVAAINTACGNIDAAFAALERGYAIRDPGLTYIQIHTGFDALKEDPRYDALLKKMGLR